MGILYQFSVGSWYNYSVVMTLREYGSKKMRVGILDDHQGICDMLSMALELAGHTASTYQDSAQFLAFVTQEQASPLSGVFDLMIVDYHLPGELSGVDVIRRVRRIYPNLPVLLISAECPRVLEAAKEGLTGVKLFPKPLRLSTLLATIKEY